MKPIVLLMCALALAMLIRQKPRDDDDNDGIPQLAGWIPAFRSGSALLVLLQIVFLPFRIPVSPTNCPDVRDGSAKTNYE